MNKLFRSGMMLLVAALAFLTVASCSNDDDTNKIPEKKLVTTRLNYTFYFLADFAQYVNVEATYTDMAGQTKTISTSTVPKKAIGSEEYYEFAFNWDSQSRPFQKNVNFKFTKKDGITLPSTIKIGDGESYVVNEKYSDGSVGIVAIRTFLGSVSGMISSNIDTEVAELNKDYGVVAITVDGQGNCSVKHSSAE